MKIAILNTYDLKGGAAKASFRLHHGLNEINVNSSMFVLNKLSKDTKVVGFGGIIGKLVSFFKKFVDYLPLLKYPGWNREIFSVGLVFTSAFKKIDILNPDVIHLHWINSGFISIEDLVSFKAPIVWTMHDMWVFTGGCHYDNNCGRYKELCGNCPSLNSKNNEDLSFKILKRKEKNWSNLNIHFVAPSNWLADCARRSSLLRNNDIRVIPNGLDFNFFKPIEKQKARKQFNLPLDKKIVLFGAAQVDRDKRKGLELFVKSLDYLSAADLDIVVFGKKDKNNYNYNDINGFKVHYLGDLDEENLLIAAYSSADVLVAPSLQENLSNMVVEAMACNIPVVAFNIGGMPDMIMHEVTGWLAKPFDTCDLAIGIRWSLNKYDTLSNVIRASAMEKFDLKIISQQYFDLYQEVLGQKL